MGDGKFCMGNLWPNRRLDGTPCEATDTYLPLQHFVQECDPNDYTLIPENICICLYEENFFDENSIFD